MSSCTTREKICVTPRAAARRWTSGTYTSRAVRGEGFHTMSFQRIWALIERDLRKFFRSPALMMSSMIFPLMQLIVLGYAFGGKIKGVKVAVVDEDHSAISRDVRQKFDAIVAGPQTMQVVNYSSVSDAEL